MTLKQRRHLKTREIPPFNIASVQQEQIAKLIAIQVWDSLHDKYKQYRFANLKSLGITSLEPEFCVNYLNRGYKRARLPTINLNDFQAFDSAGGIKPDAGVFFVKAKDDDFYHIIGTLEVKHQGEYNGYTPISNSDWKKSKYRRAGPENLDISQRPPQAQGNAIERFAKNANAIKTLTSFYGYNPYVVLCEGFDFYLKEEFYIFEKQPFSDRFKGHDSAILMRPIAGNEWMSLNKVYVICFEHGQTKKCPATIMARMRKWTTGEGVKIMLDVIDIALKHLKSIDEID